MNALLHRYDEDGCADQEQCCVYDIATLFVAPNKPGSPPSPSSPYSACVSQAYAAAAAQPAVTPGQQDLIDGFVGAVAGALSDGTSALATRILKGFGIGLASQSATHLVQQGAAFKATLDGCQAQVQGGIYIPMTPPIP